MAMFEKAFSITMGHEGAFSNDPNDSGGMTFWGIARKYHPAWEGWPLVDERLASGLTRKQLTNYELSKRVKAFYKAEFWDKINGDKIESQKIANEVFDTCVNIGISVAAKMLQEVINACTQDVSVQDLVVDGVIGQGTLGRLNALAKTVGNEILKALNCQQGSYYLHLTQIRRKDKKFFIGWIRQRVSMQ